MRKCIFFIIVCVALLVPEVNFGQALVATIVNPARSVATDIKPLKESVKNVMVSIYPNPFTTSLCINVHNTAHINTSEFLLYDVSGEIVLSKVLTKQVNMVETCDLPSGVYFYKALNENKTIQSGRLISQQ